jgi:hypothetical protein
VSRGHETIQEANVTQNRSREKSRKVHSRLRGK